jgi:HEAT repeat protein
MRQVGGVLLCLTAACSPKPAPEASPYVVTTDVTPWIRALESDDLFETQPAVAGLAALGPAVIPALERAFKTETTPVRVGIVEVLSDLRVPETLPLLLRAARDPEPEVRADALDALGRLRDEQGREAVEAGLGDSDMSVVTAAARACVDLCRSREAMEALVHHALAGAGAAYQSLVAILRAGNAEQSAAAREAVNDLTPEVIESDANPEMRVRAALVLVEVSPERALPLVRDCAVNGSQPLLRMQAIAALGAAGTQRDAQVLKDLYNSPSGPFARRAGCNAMRQMVVRGILHSKDVPATCPGPTGAAK